MHVCGGGGWGYLKRDGSFVRVQDSATRRWGDLKVNWKVREDIVSGSKSGGQALWEDGKWGQPFKPDKQTNQGN